MIRYLLKRTLRNKSCHIALAAGFLISIGYFVLDIWPNRNYGGTPYNMWIESVTASQFPSIFFTILPIIAALPMAGTYFRDKNNGYIDLIMCKGNGKIYFKSLFGLNFLAGGFAIALPLILNVYLSFMVLIDRKPDLVTDDPLNITVFDPITIFPELYFSHPLVHMLLYIFIGFMMAGMMASVALAFSLFLKNRFFVYLSSFILTYIYSAIAMMNESTRNYIPSRIVVQTGGVSSINSFLIVETVGICLSLAIYIGGVKKNVIK